MTAFVDRSGEYRAPAGGGQAELRDRGSRFLAVVRPAADSRQATAVIAELRATYREATHHCWAWRLGDPARERASDDGEPTGTAGRPILIALEDLSDVVAVVVRWFGGTKLGKGGLARAYGSAARLALAETPTVRRFPTDEIGFELAYDQLGGLRRLIDPPEIVLVEERFGAAVSIVLRVARRRRRGLIESLRAVGISPTGEVSGLL